MHVRGEMRPDRKTTMRKYLLSVLAIIAGTIIAAETAERGFDSVFDVSKHTGETFIKGTF